MNSFYLYLIMQMDVLRDGFFAMLRFSSLVSLLIAVWYVFALMDERGKDEVAKITKLLKVSGIVLSILIILTLIIPSTKTAAIMYTVPKIVNSDFCNKDLPQDAQAVYNLAVDRIKKELTNSKNNSDK